MKSPMESKDLSILILDIITMAHIAWHIFQRRKKAEKYFGF